MLTSTLALVLACSPPLLPPQVSRDFEGPGVVLRERFLKGKESSLTLVDASGAVRWRDPNAIIVHGLQPTFSSDGTRVAYESAPGVVTIYDPKGGRTEVNVLAALSPEEQQRVPRACGGPFIQWLRFDATSLVVPIRQEAKPGPVRGVEVMVQLETKTVGRRPSVELTSAELIDVYRSEPVRRREVIQRLRPKALSGDEKASSFFRTQAKDEPDGSLREFLQTVLDGLPRQ